MGFRKVALLTEIFALTAMSSVGFSSWLAIQTTPVSNEINVNVENIVNTDKYVTIGNMVFSEISSTGFVNDFTISDESSTIGKLDFDIIFNITEYSKTIGSVVGKNLTFDVEISSNFSVNGTNICSLFDIDNTSGSYIFQTQTEQPLNEISHTESTENLIPIFFDVSLLGFPLLTINLKYAFDFSGIIPADEGSFEKDVYPLLNGKDIPFNVSVAIRT